MHYSVLLRKNGQALGLELVLEQLLLDAQHLAQPLLANELHLPVGQLQLQRHLLALRSHLLGRRRLSNTPTASASTTRHISHIQQQQQQQQHKDKDKESLPSCQLPVQTRQHGAACGQAEGPPRAAQVARPPVAQITKQQTAGRRQSTTENIQQQRRSKPNTHNRPTRETITRHRITIHVSFHSFPQNTITNTATPHPSIHPDHPPLPPLLP